ncbi:alpha/beta fold hydrolase [Maricaulis parjimensis]|uniref:alpha/beta fold hydrolase n=1 Tax=Maricaulis parjimensis TaxID=144023 RepID=UPI001EEDA2BD|nr:alpha/beta hydrolase [Maricaulis parjimensis]
MTTQILSDPVILTGLAGLGLLALLGLAAWINVRRIEQAHPPGGAFETVDGVRLHYRETGPKSAPATLVLHGAASNLEEPHSALANTFDGEHVIWLDRPGLGWSQRPSGHWSPQREAALIAKFLEARKSGPVTVIGHSWGGAIAMRLAMDHPDRVSGLVLVAPALSAWIGRAAWFNSASFWPVLGPLITRIIVPLAGPSQARSGAIAAFHPEPMPDAYVEKTALSLLLRPAIWRANARDMALVNTHLEDQEHAYEELDHPAVVIAGKADTVLWSHRHGGQVAKRMKRAEMRWISGAGHNLHHHHPAAVLEAVRDVRNELRETGSKAGAAG